MDNEGNNYTDTIDFFIDIPLPEPDTTKPYLSVLTPINGTVYTSENITAKWYGYDLESGMKYYSIRLDETIWINASLANEYTFHLLSNGSHSLEIQAFDYAIISGWKSICEKANGLCILPGFCAFRKSAIEKIGGFKGDTPVEDYDICFYLRKAGFDIRMTDAVAYTRVPETIRGWLRQRVRWIRGTLQVVKKHYKFLFNRKHVGVGFFSVPTQLYWYFHSFLYLPLVLYQILSGYFNYFLAYGNVISLEVFKYFFNWFTVFGMVELIYKTLIGAYALTPLLLLTIVVFILSLCFNFYSLFRFSEFNIYNLIAFIFFFPYVLIILFAYWIGTLLEFYERRNFSKWEKCR